VTAAARKTVTVLFCDLTQSTNLGEQLDPEALRELLGRWHDEMRIAVEHHSGTVEKFIGDALMAVFGEPLVHEDDALRAARAALEMRERLDALNAELRDEGRPQLQMRTGINSGEVVTGDRTTTLVTGDAVNTAKRLEEAAAAGEILIGDTTRRLVENATMLEFVGPVAAKGKREPVVSWRVLATIEGAAPIVRRLDAPLVGRTRELAELREELAAASRDRVCRLVTVHGPAGVGKSRLARELVRDLGESACVVSTRCLPYGDGLTLLPLTELIRSADVETIVAAAREEPDSALIAERLHNLLDDVDTPSTQETFWAIRRALEVLGRERPLVVCVEDVHWAEPTFLDLLEYLAGWTTGAAVLLLCLARPELLDERPRWGGDAIALQPLSEDESQQLLDALAAEWTLPPDALATIAETAEGNPLFVEQMVAMLAETGTTAVPPTIQALLAARLDQLDPIERAVLERAAVVGRDFLRGAVVALSPPEEHAAIGPTLLSLVRKEFVRPQPSPVAGDDGFRFRHALIRDAAYSVVPKEMRATLHEQFARWLDDRDAADELVGYHLEQAFHSHADLGIHDDAVAERAAERLLRAGRRAFEREDMPAAANLLERALALADLGEERPAVLRELGSARWRIGDVGGARSATDLAIELAGAAGDVQNEWYARLDRAARIRMERGDGDDLEEVARSAAGVFAELGDDRGLARAYRRLSLVSITNWHFTAAAEHAEVGLRHARRADEPSENAGLADLLCTALLRGTEPAAAAEERCRLLLDESGPPSLTAAVSSTLSCLVAMQASFADARALAADAAAIYDRLGLRLPRAGLAEVMGEVELLAGDLDAADRHIRFAFETLVDVGSLALAGLHAARLARLAAEQRRLRLAAEHLDFARRHSDRQDRDGVVELALAEGAVALAQDRRDDAETHVEHAAAIVTGTEHVSYRAETLALRAALASVEPIEAIALYEEKGNVAAAERLRELAAHRLPR